MVGRKMRREEDSLRIKRDEEDFKVVLRLRNIDERRGEC